ncbi:hypothetical protein C173_14780 [Paenibacillus sp. FSL R7-277]|nr:hypothetical protein C173_14780 [Paenibacillus sp. FSL R7-277]
MATCQFVHLEPAAWEDARVTANPAQTQEFLYFGGPGLPTDHADSGAVKCKLNSSNSSWSVIFERRIF